MPAGRDTKYLQETIGDALARGCAAAIAGQPNDPVEYLGQWLLRYVRNAEIEGEFYKQRDAELESKKAALEAEAAAAQKLKEEQDARKEAIEELSKTVAEPRELLQKAVDLIKQFTSAGAAYAAAIAEPEEADWAYPEDPEDPAAAESDDEPDPAPAEPAEGDAPAEAEAPPAEEAPAEGTDDAAAGSAKPTLPVDYSKKYFSYVLGTEGQEFISKVEIFRPPPPPEDDPEAKVDPPAFTFRILDEKRPMVYTPNVAFEPSIKFFKSFPKIGSYQACAVQCSGGEYKAIIAADTLFPEAHGQALSQEDQDFIWEVSLALSKAYDTVEQQAQAKIKSQSATEAVEVLKKKIFEVYNPPPPEPAEGEVPPAPAPPATPPPPAEEAPAEEAPPPEEGAEPVVVLDYEVKTLTKELAAAEASRDAAAKALELARDAFSHINKSIQSSSSQAVHSFKYTGAVPQATFHVLKAVLYVLGKEADTFSNWKRAFQHFSGETFQQVVEFDATAERELGAWKKARCAYKGLADPKKLEAEFPDTLIGLLLLMWLKQCRKVGRKAAAFRAAHKAADDLAANLEAKKVALEEAIVKKAEEEEAARKAAEEEAARLAAEGAGEEGGEEEGGDE